MKVRICPECGKQNPAHAWYCADASCGALLSVKTITESDDDLVEPDVKESHEAAAQRESLASVDDEQPTAPPAPPRRTEPPNGVQPATTEQPATPPETGRTLPRLAAGVVGAVLFTIIGALLGSAIGESLSSWSLLEGLIGWLIGALVGSPIGAWLGVSIAGAVLGREPRPWPIIILATAVGLGVGGGLSFWML